MDLKIFFIDPAFSFSESSIINDMALYLDETFVIIVTSIRQEQISTYHDLSLISVA